MRWLVLGACTLAAAALSGTSSSKPPTALLTYSISYRSLGGSGPPSGRVCLARSDGTHAVRLLSNGDYREVAWSPGGRYFVFSKQLNGSGPAFEVYLATARGRIVRNLSRGWGDFNGSPAWSPDGRWIAFVGARYGSAIAVVSRKGGKPRLLVSGGGSPAWSPDGSRIVFSSEEGISSIRRDGTDRRLLVAGAGQPALSHDGTKLAYVRSGEGFDADVFVADADGTNERRVTSSPEREWAPSWSSEGRLIAFNRWNKSPTDDRYWITVVEADTGEEQTVIRGPYSAFDPSWRAPVNLPRAKRLPCR